MTPERAALRFAVPGRLVAVLPAGNGNVNDTYQAIFRTAFDETRFILQKINTKVFTRPDRIMANLRVLTDHVIHRLDREAGRADRVWQLPRIIPCRDGKDYFTNAGGAWRAITLIASARAFDLAQSPEHAREVGAVLGQFHRLVSNLSPALVEETLPGFHVTPLYLKRYDLTRKSAASRRRLKAQPEARRLAAFIEARRPLAGILEAARARGELAPRLIHGDPKVNNIMIDELTGKGTSIVDLDTVQPGLIHYDFGDALRSIANPAGEEASDLSQVRFDLSLCRAFVGGYLSSARDFLTKNDRRHLYDSVRLIAFELGLRFFEDHLAGDIYFKVKRPGQNLRRARVQLRLCADIEAREREIRRALSSG